MNIDLKTKIIDGELCISSGVMLDIFHISKQTLGNWAKSGCPKSKQGWWPLAGVIEWKLGGDKKTPDDELSDGALKLKYEAELKRLQVEQLDLKNAVANGDYIPRDEIVSELSRYFIELKRSFMGLSRKVITHVGPYVDSIVARRIENELADIVNDALTRIGNGEIYAPRKTIKRKGK